MAPQPLGPLGPMARVLLTTIGTQDADLILSQALKMNMHEVQSHYSFRANNTTLEFLLGSIASGQRPTYQPTTNPSGFIVKQEAYPPDSYSRRELNARTLERYKDGGISYEVDSPFCNVRTNISVRQSKSLEDQEIGKRFAPLRKAFSTQLQELFPDGDDTGTFIVPALNVRSQVLSIKDRRNGVGNTCSNLLHLETNSCLILPILISVFLAFLMMHCDRSFVKPAIWLGIARRMCDGRPFASSPFLRLAGRGTLFSRFPPRWAMQFAISLWLDA